MSNVFVSVDIEGISGVVHGEMMMNGQSEYTRGRRLMMDDANAAIEGLVQGGAEHILVNDGHGPMRNLMIEDLHAAAHLVSGAGEAKELCQLEGVESEAFDFAVFIGYHAMAKTYNAIHPHTIAGAVVNEIRINGRPHGETGINAAVLASMGIPTVMVTGDSATITEALDFLGDNLATVEVKRSRGRNAAICRAPAATQPEITATAQRVAGDYGRIGLYTPSQPWRLEVDMLRMAQADRAERIAGVERVGPQTLICHGDSPIEQYRVLWAALRNALYEPAGWLG